MNTFKRKALFTAVLAGLGAAGSAEAVYVNPNAVGEVLVYPYYTLKEGQVPISSYGDYLVAVNLAPAVQAAKVVAMDSISWDVLDFNLNTRAREGYISAESLGYLH